MNNFLLLLLFKQHQTSMKGRKEGGGKARQGKGKKMYIHSCCCWLQDPETFVCSGGEYSHVGIFLAPVPLPLWMGGSPRFRQLCFFSVAICLNQLNQTKLCCGTKADMAAPLGRQAKPVLIHAPLCGLWSTKETSSYTDYLKTFLSVPHPLSFKPALTITARLKIRVWDFVGRVGIEPRTDRLWSRRANR